MPVFEPVTLIPVRSLIGAPRKLIWVVGDAAWLPFDGNTATGKLVPDEVFIRAATKSAATTAAPAIRSLLRLDKAADPS